ncbi:MAG: glycoside hydrolase family 97 protein [Hyphomonas sp.]|uniref:glycoside hydrolase family 97 protein n=1 Tax=Hyphomonas sp. TaxID=87 RepID=UPI003528A2BC
MRLIPLLNGLVFLALAACSTVPSRPAALPAAPTPLPAATGAQSVTSPDGALVVTLSDSAGHPTWSATYSGEQILKPARLGLRFLEAGNLDDGLVIIGAETRSVDTPWEQPWGEQRLMREHYNELLVRFADPAGTGRYFDVRIRAFDDGLGFRYEVPQLTAGGNVSLIDELTEFSIDEHDTAWWIEAGNYNRYEYIYHTTEAAAIDRAHTPMTVRTDKGTHITFHEAALVDYAAMWLDQQRPGVLKASLVPWSDGVRVKKNGAFTTPWRTVQVSSDAKGLLNSHLILNLNEPNKLGDVSWVKPGRYVGIWWCMHIKKCTWGSGEIHGATTERTREYMDFAAKYGFDGVLVEGWNIGWDGDWFNNGALFSFTEPYPDFDIEELSRYGAAQGVRLIGHNETSGNITNYENQLQDAFALYEKLGIAQVKTGYVADGGGIQRQDEDGTWRYEWHDSQVMARHHLHVVEEAARHHISINAHEPIKDTGLRRTYPNWISREGARGQEYNAWGYPHLNPPEHETILPWTRMMSGPMDFTPGIFDLTFDGPDADNRVQTTLAKQLALYVVLYSPIQMAADLPENYEARPEAFEFITRVPTDWEQSIAIAGEVGEYVAYARQERAGEDWFLGTVTDENGRTVSLPTDYLTPGVTYTAKVWVDGPGADWKTAPYDLSIYTRDLQQGDTLTLTLAPGGGAAVWLTPVTTQ